MTQVTDLKQTAGKAWAKSNGDDCEKQSDFSTMTGGSESLIPAESRTDLAAT